MRAKLGLEGCVARVIWNCARAVLATRHAHIFLPATALAGLLSCLALAHSAVFSLMAQTEKSNADRWLDALPPVPEFSAPATRGAWEKQRGEIRAKLAQSLGKIPARPVTAAVKTLSREDRGEYFFEKFSFDNGAGATVPGYVFVPKKSAQKFPAILYCHWHGGQYDIGKEEMFRTNATPVAAGPDLARRGFVVLGVDAYCFGERNGAGPGGPAEKGGAGEMTASKFNLWAGRSLWG